MGWAEHDVDVLGVSIHYYRRGEGRPVVLAHGVTDSGLCWERVAQRLEDEFDVIAYDAPLHGQSGGDQESMQLRGEVLVGVVDALGLEAPAAMGHSMGAGAVSDALALRPKMFRRAILEDPGWWDEEQLSRMRAATGRSTRRPDGEPAPTIAQITRRGREQNPTWSEEEFPAWAMAKQQYRGQPSTPKSTWRDVVPKFACPVLVIAGEPERGSIAGEQSAKEALAMCPSARLVRLPTGHNVRREAFDQFVALATEFLREP